MGVITLMGSGEISPTMVKVHRAVLERYPSPRAVFVDTPFGFQANADEITAKVSDFFTTSLNTALETASMRSAAHANARTIERMLALVRSADYLFAGPGSPSYALRNWQAIGFRAAVAQVLAAGGSVTLASAAAVTAGAVSLPVYEIYKVGEDPHWLPGLDLLDVAGLKASVIPHYDNAEGGTHDTRYCYLGKERFDLLRARLDEDTVVIGVDEHTALVIDLDTQRAEVMGRGAAHFVSGSYHHTLSQGEGAALAECLPPGGTRHRSVPVPPAPRHLDFDRALADRDAGAAVEAALATERSDDRTALRGMISKLGDAAEVGLTDPRNHVSGYIETMLELRERARTDQRWIEADFIRDKLIELGVIVRDTGDGTEWDLA